MFGIFSRKKREYSVYLPPKPKPIYELDIKVFNGKEVVHHRILDVEEWNSLPNIGENIAIGLPKPKKRPNK